VSGFRSDDPIRDFAKWEREQQAWEDSLPRCDSCGEPVDDYVFDIDGEVLCIECMIAKYRRDAEDYCS
jgi:formylmethanofuran dehydrogenase subunit E